MAGGAVESHNRPKLTRGSRLLAALLITMVVLFPAGVALAHYVYSHAWTHYSSDNCVWGYAETSHGSGGGYAKVIVESWRRNVLGWSCQTHYDRPQNYIRLKYTFWKWNGSEWVVCRDTNFTYNTSTTWTMRRTQDHGTTPPCGTGYYGTQGYGYASHAGTWYGGGIWSGSHWLP